MIGFVARQNVNFCGVANQTLTNYVTTVCCIIILLVNIIVLYCFYTPIIQEWLQLEDNYTVHKIHGPRLDILETSEQLIRQYLCIPYILVYKSNFLDAKMGSKNRPRLIFGRT